MINSNLQISNYSTTNSAPKLKPTRLKIFHYNDTHGNSDQMAGLIESAIQFKKDSKYCSSFVLSAGDNVSGADVKKNSFIFNLMKNLLHVDVSAVGNHEIDSGSNGFCEALKDNNINFVACNVRYKDGNKMPDTINKSIVKEQNGEKFGFIGVMPMDFTSCTKKAVQEDIEIMDFDDTVKAVQNEIANLQKQNVNKIILLSHSGYDVDKKLAQNLDGIDVVIGGHSHSLVEKIEKDENLVASKSGKPVLIVQAGENGKHYGVLDISFDPDGIITSVNSGVKASKHTVKSPIIEYIKNKFLGFSPKIASINKINEMPKNRRISPNAWTNLLADSMKEELGGDIAFINSANVRKIPQVGTLTQRDVTESTPMKNKLIKTKVTQKQVVEAIKNASKKSLTSSEGEPGLLQVSGLRYKVNNNGDLLELYFVDKAGKMQPIDINNPSEEITYNAIYDDFVMQKDGEYPELTPKFEVEQFDFDKDKTAIDYIKKLANKDLLEVIDDNRIEIIQTSQDILQNNNNQKSEDSTFQAVA